MMQIMNNIKSRRIFEKIMPLCLALFFVRTVFIGYKYLFFATFVPCFLYSVYVLFKQGVARPKFKTLLLPILVIALFFVHFLPFSNVVKESANIALIVYFIVFSKLYYGDDKLGVFLKWIVRLTLFAGIIAIVRLILVQKGIRIPMEGFVFEGGRFPLVNDNNFYSMFFILATLISFGLVRNKRISVALFLVVNLISGINIALSMSRRGYVLFFLLLLLISVVAIVKHRGEIKLLLCSTLPLLLISIGCVGAVLYYGNKYDGLSLVAKDKYYKLYTICNSGITFEEFDFRQHMKCQPKNQFQIGDNLFSNGDLKQGLEGWGYTADWHDCLKINLVEDADGSNVIRVNRGCSSGEWQILYTGRPIFYHKDVTYDLSFVYRVLEGVGQRFDVGWGIYEGQNDYMFHLPQEITAIDSVWTRCDVSYKFKRDYLNPRCFLRSLKAGSTIEVKDISLTCDDTTGLPMYADQLSDSVIHSFFTYLSGDTINYFTAPRTARWRYALELWQTRYTTQQKIFGQGFKYLEWYGEKFYNNPKRYDFPHNPIISSFLYSGIIGGIVYIIFLISSLWLYWKKRKTMGIFFIMYLCCMFFCMFSGSSHFSFPLFAFLSFMPFIEYKNNSEVNDKICLDNL